MLGLLLKGWRSLFIKENTVPVAVRTKCVCKTFTLTWVQKQGASLTQIYPVFIAGTGTYEREQYQHRFTSFQV